MINFIIYGNDKNVLANYEKMIMQINKKRVLKYKIYFFDTVKDFDNNIKKISGKKIFILGVYRECTSGLEIANKIRKKGDWLNQIIMITDFCNEKYLDIANKLLLINFISKFDNWKEEMLFSIEAAINILEKNLVLTFRSDGRIIRLLYSDIYYIEKNSGDNDSIIVTRGNEYIIKETINGMMKLIGENSNFFKCHRSCIVNLDNIINFDLKHNTISFYNKEIDLVARNKKKELENRILECK